MIKSEKGPACGVVLLSPVALELGRRTQEAHCLKVQCWLHSRFCTSLGYRGKPALKKKMWLMQLKVVSKLSGNENEPGLIATDSIPTSTFCFSDNAFVLMHDRTFDPHNEAGM